MDFRAEVWNNRLYGHISVTPDIVFICFVKQRLNPEFRVGRADVIRVIRLRDDVLPQLQQNFGCDLPRVQRFQNTKTRSMVVAAFDFSDIVVLVHVTPPSYIIAALFT